MIKLEKDYENEINNVWCFQKHLVKIQVWWKVLICFKHKVCNEFISVIIYMC